MTPSLSALQAAASKAEEAAQKAAAELAAAQREQAKAQFGELLGALKSSAAHFTTGERKRLRAVLDALDAPDKAPKKKKRQKNRPAKYQLKTGENWSGMGRTPVAFLAWEKTKAGQAWAKSHDRSQRFPPA